MKEMEVVCEKACVFEDSLEIDFDYEFDVDKYFDFLREETVEEIMESESWFYSAQEHPPSPLLLKLGLVTKEPGGSDATSSRSGHEYACSSTSDGGESEVSSQNQWKKGPESMKLKPANQPRLSKSSRLLQPTASHLAKQIQQICVCGTRSLGRVQKPGNPPKSPEDIMDATKRQKLENGYLRKAAKLKHQLNFMHKLSRQVGSSNVNSCPAKPKATIPKEPCLQTANRAQRRCSKSDAQLSRDPKHDSCSVKAQSVSRKTLEPKKSTPSVPPESKGSKKSGSCSLKEKKTANTIIGKFTRCGMKQNQFGGGRMTVIAC